jgi:hypothetical protein
LMFQVTDRLGVTEADSRPSEHCAKFSTSNTPEGLYSEFDSSLSSFGRVMACVAPKENGRKRCCKCGKIEYEARKKEPSAELFVT